MDNHNILTREKKARAKKQAWEAFKARKSLSEIGFVAGQGAYEDYLAHVYSRGEPKVDRTGTGTLSVFGYQMRFDLSKGFPLITTKKVHMRSFIIELLWFLRGDNNVKWLQENGCTIWDEWARPDGSLGPVYGIQWRSWPAPNGRHIDQIAQVIQQLKSNPDSRRIIVSAWNVADLEEMALMPCHAFFQFYVRGPKQKRGRRRLCCQVYQRSVDSFLGLPFNIASFALLIYMIAEVCDMDVGDLVWTGGDCHIYSNHLHQVETQLGREPKPFPQMVFNRKPTSIDDFRYEDFQLVGYESHPAIPAPVAK